MEQISAAMSSLVWRGAPGGQYIRASSRGSPTAVDDRQPGETEVICGWAASGKGGARRRGVIPNTLRLANPTRNAPAELAVLLLLSQGVCQALGLRLALDSKAECQ